MKTIFILIIILIFLSSCEGFKNDLKTNLTTKEKDSIYSTLGLVCGDWEYDGDKKQYLEKRGIFPGEMSITCSVTINDYKWVNDFFIDETYTLGSIGTVFPKFLDSLFLPVSDSVMILKRKEYYGFLYKGDTSIFIPIKTINDSLLILVDGRRYRRSK